MIAVPADFNARLRNIFPADAPRWLAGVPTIFARLLDEWGLRPNGSPMHGCVGLVLPVRRADGSRAALKVSYPDKESRTEGLALSTWNGRSAVRLLAESSADNALLLEMLDSARELNIEPIEVAVTECAALARKLAVPAPPGLRSVRAESAELLTALPQNWVALGKPLPRKHIDIALEVCRTLGPVSASFMVNEDLHYANVLYGRGEWLAIDPKPIEGDPEFGVIPLLWNRFDEMPIRRRLDIIIAHTGFNAEKVHAWTFLRAVHNALWERSTGGIAAAQCCELIADTVLPALPAGLR